MNEVEREFQIEERIRASFIEAHAALFWPDQFVDADLGDQEQVMIALGSLAKHGKLRAVIQVHSSAAHLCWQGSPTEFRLLRPFECGECGETFDPAEDPVRVHFVIAEAWRDALASQKKIDRSATR